MTRDRQLGAWGYLVTHIRARLSPLRGETARIMGGRGERGSGGAVRDGVVSLHGHAFGRIRLTRKGKCGLGGGGVLLVQQTRVAGDLSWGGQSSGVCDSGGDDTLIGGFAWKIQVLAVYPAKPHPGTRGTSRRNVPGGPGDDIGPSRRLEVRGVVIHAF